MGGNENMGKTGLKKGMNEWQEVVHHNSMSACQGLHLWYCSYLNIDYSRMTGTQT